MAFRVVVLLGLRHAMPFRVLGAFVAMVVRVLGVKRLPEGAFCRQKPQLRRGGHTVQRPAQPRGHLWPDPDHQFCRLQIRRLAGAHLELMRIGPLFQQKRRLAQIAHHLRHQRMDRRHVGDHARHFGQRGGGAGQKEGYDITHHLGLSSGLAKVYECNAITCQGPRHAA